MMLNDYQFQIFDAKTGLGWCLDWNFKFSFQDGFFELLDVRVCNMNIRMQFK